MIIYLICVSIMFYVAPHFIMSVAILEYELTKIWEKNR